MEAAAARSAGLPGGHPRILFLLPGSAVAALWLLVWWRGVTLPPAGRLRDALGLPAIAPPSEAMYLAAFALCSLALAASWFAAARAAGRLGAGLPAIARGACALALPMVLLPAIYSDDVYLYHFYGRELVSYGVNPLLVPPSAFSGDPHLEWVYWKWLPSAYGPLWLSLSAPVTALAGDSITAAVVLYRLLGLAAHLAAAALIWCAVRRIDAPRAPAAAAFFAWNPFVLFESVASAHNDATMVAFIAAAVVAAAAARWHTASAALAAAAMVKPYAVLLFVPLAACAWFHAAPRRLSRVAKMAAVAGGSAAALYAPLWAGDALLRNVLANPASGAYSNTLWDLAARQLATPSMSRTWLEGTLMDPLRLAVLAGALAASVAVARRRDFAAAALVAWVGFCFAASWLWPWYFVPAIAFAACGGPRARALAAAITVGGLLFYLGWPRPSAALSWLYTWRSALLFGPPLATLAALAISGRHRRRRALRFDAAAA